MSEPVTNSEIEDVLSAVRRLVSESGGTKRDPMEEGQTALVLTPAFRVDDRARKASGDVSVEDMVHEALAEVAGVIVESELAPEDTANAEVPNERQAEDEASEQESLPEDAYEAPFAEMQEPSEAAHAAPDHAEPYFFAQPEPAPVAPDDETLRTLEDRIAELEAVVSEEQHDWEPDGSEAADEPDRIVFRHAAAEAHVAEDDLPEPPMVEVVHVDEADDWEDVSGEEMSFAEVLEDANEEPLDAYEYAPETADYVAPEPSEDEADDLVIDEDMLREIVGRLVREELQGTMGERITRNLRRMVRREIARALALKDFE